MIKKKKMKTMRQETMTDNSEYPLFTLTMTSIECSLKLTLVAMLIMNKGDETIMVDNYRDVISSDDHLL